MTAKTDVAKTDTVNLVAKLVKVRESLKALKKDKQAFGYKYADEEQVVGQITKALNEQGIDFRCSIVQDNMSPLTVTPITLRVKDKDKGAKEGDMKDKLTFLISGLIAYTFTNAENPTDTMTDLWPFAGQQDDPSQAAGSAATYANRYYLLKRFLMATGKDDPDRLTSLAKQREAGEATSSLPPVEMTAEQAKGMSITVGWGKGDTRVDIKGLIGELTDEQLALIVGKDKLPDIHKRAAALVLADRKAGK